MTSLPPNTPPSRRDPVRDLLGGTAPYDAAIRAGRTFLQAFLAVLIAGNFLEISAFEGAAVAGIASVLTVLHGLVGEKVAPKVTLSVALAAFVGTGLALVLGALLVWAKGRKGDALQEATWQAIVSALTQLLTAAHAMETAVEKLKLAADLVASDLAESHLRADKVTANGGDHGAAADAASRSPEDAS